MNKNKNFNFPPLVSVTLSLITGILIPNFYPDLPLGLFAGISLLILAIVSYFFSRQKSLVLWLCFFALLWGLFSCAGDLNPVGFRETLSPFADFSKYAITGEIISFSQDFPRKKRVLVSCYLLEKKGRAPIKVTGRIRLNIYDKNNKIFRYRDRIQFTSPLRPIRNFSNPNGFDYEKYMKFEGVFGSAYASASKIRVIPQPLPAHVQIIRSLEQLRNRFFYFIMDQMENKNAAAILAALVTGKKEGIPTELKEVFSKAGAAHILAMSI